MVDAPVVYPLREPMKDYFKLNNWLVDVGIKELSGHAFKLLLYVYRETVGRGNPNGREMSNRELLAAANARSYTTVQASILELQTKEYLIVTKKGKWDTVHYQVNSDLQKSPAATESVAKIARYRKCSATDSVASPLQKVKRSRYTNRSAVATESVDILKTEDIKHKKDNSADALPAKEKKKRVYPPNVFFEMFRKAFEEFYHDGCPELTAGFVQFAALKRRHKGDLSEVEFAAAIANYFLSDVQHTFADLCTRYHIFKKGPTDRYGKQGDLFSNGNGANGNGQNGAAKSKFAADSEQRAESFVKSVSYFDRRVEAAYRAADSAEALVKRTSDPTGPD